MDRFDQIIQKTNEVLDRAHALYGVRIRPTIRFNLTGRVAGWACCKFNRYTGQVTDASLRFNRTLIAGDHFEDMRDETVPHEVAHLVCHHCPQLGRNHDAGWRRVCLALGGNGQTRHSYTVEHAAGSFVYVTTSGSRVMLSHIRHKRVQEEGGSYRFRDGGRADRYCAWAPSGQTPVARLTRPETRSILFQPGLLRAALRSG